MLRNYYVACVWSVMLLLGPAAGAADLRGLDLAWDAFNRLVTANGITYLYDAQDRRVAKCRAGEQTPYEVYIYNDWSVIAVLDGATGNVLTEFVEGARIDEHILMIDYRSNSAGTPYFYVQDPNNHSVQMLVNEAGHVVETYAYTAYGETTIQGADNRFLTQSAIGNPYGFQGRWYDHETGLYYFRHRYYMPEMKRFITHEKEICYSTSGLNLNGAFCYCYLHTLSTPCCNQSQ